jgi:SAM-dependent methyltransferase
LHPTSLRRRRERRAVPYTRPAEVRIVPEHRVPYQPEFARLYGLVVHGEVEPQATAAEIEFLTWALQSLAQREVREVIDVGCGEGRMLLPLAREGLTMTGLDNSPDMLAICRTRLKRARLKAELIEKGMAELPADRQWDAVIAVDSVISYAHETEALLEVLRGFRRALRPGGLLVLDNWNMLGNWPLLGKTQTFKGSGPGISVEGKEWNRYDSMSSIWEIEISATVREGKKQTSLKNKERLRCLTVPETEAYLRQAGFGWVRSFRDYKPEDETTPVPEQVQFAALAL